MNNFVAINFTYIRKISLLKQKEFAKKIGISPATLSTYERGVNNPSIELIQKICKDNNIKIDDFVNKDLSKLKSKKTSGSENIKKNKTVLDYRKEGVNNIFDFNKVVGLIFENYEKIIRVKNEQIDEKEKHIESLVENLKTAKRESEAKDALLNQNEVSSKLQQQITKLYAYFKIENEILKASSQDEV